MDMNKLVQAARRFASRHMPTTAKGSARLAGLLGGGLRVLDRATHNGRMLRMTGNSRLAQIADGLTGSAASILRQPGTAGILRKASDKASSAQLRGLVKGLIAPEAYGAAFWTDPGFRRLANKLRNQISSLPVINTDNMSKRILHNARANYTDVLRGVGHGAPNDAYAAANLELQHTLNSRKGVKDAVDDLLELTIPKDVPGVGGQKVPLTGRNLNGAVYLEEAAATPEQRRVLAQVIGRSNVPIGTTVMADIGEAMQRYPGMHVVAQADGGWFDPSGTKSVVPKLILVNDAALKSGHVEDIIAQHRELYSPSFIKRTKFMDPAALASIRENKRGFSAWNNVAKSVMLDSDKQILADFKDASDKYRQAASTGFLPVGYVKDNARLRGMRRQLEAVRKQLSSATAAGDQISAERLRTQLADLQVQYGALENAARVTEANKIPASIRDLDSMASDTRRKSQRAAGVKALMNDVSLIGDPEEAATQFRADASQDNIQKLLDARQKIPEYPVWDDNAVRMSKINPDNMTKRGAAGSAIGTTLRNAWHLYRTSPGKALQKTLEYGAVQGPLATLTQMFNPKTLVSNKALGARYLREIGYDSAEAVKDFVRRDRTAQALTAAGLTTAGLGTYALTRHGAGKAKAPASPVRPYETPATPASAAEASQPVMQAPTTPEVVETAQAATTAPAAVHGGSATFQQALDWARNHKTELGAGAALTAALTAAVLGGAHLANRRKRKRRQTAY